MTDKVFIDTNILVYSMDTHEKSKRNACRSVLRKIQRDYIGVISTQVMQEFYVTVTKKLGIDPLVAKNILHTFENYEIVLMTPALVNEAIDCSIINQMSFWDSLIITAAECARCSELWTEDLNHGQIVRGVTVRNPLLKKG